MMARARRRTTHTCKLGRMRMMAITGTAWAASARARAANGGECKGAKRQGQRDLRGRTASRGGLLRCGLRSAMRGSLPGEQDDTQYTVRRRVCLRTERRNNGEVLCVANVSADVRAAAALAAPAAATGRWGVPRSFAGCGSGGTDVDVYIQRQASSSISRVTYIRVHRCVENVAFPFPAAFGSQALPYASMSKARTSTPFTRHGN